jgi:hypothetical protein
MPVNVTTSFSFKTFMGLLCSFGFKMSRPDDPFRVEVSIKFMFFLWLACPFINGLLTPWVIEAN